MIVEFSLSAKDLSNVAGAFKGTSDPFAVVTHIATEAGDSPKVLGKTEVIKNTLSPEWTKVFLVDYELGTPLRLAVSVFDEVRKGDNKSMGSAVFEVGALLGARGNTKAKNIKRGGKIIAHVRKSTGSGVLRMKLAGEKLTNTEGWLRKSDPFFELCRRIDSAGGDTWDNVFRSKTVKDNLSPTWPDVVVELSTLCGGDLDKPVLVRVFDFEKSGDHVLMGEFETSVNGLANASGNEPFTMKKKGKDTGKIIVHKALVLGTQSVEERLSGASISSPPEPGIGSFVDYVSGGCELNVVVAIDFTGSNGNPREPGTLHYLDPDGKKNDYEKAITAILGILSKYDSDQKYPVLGFGAKYDGVVRHCFRCGPNGEEAQGVEGVLEAYRQVFQTGLILSRPTVFTEVMETAAARAESQFQAAVESGSQSYTILLILTDGSVSDVGATAEVLDKISNTPLSIVIVGVGDADFGAMNFLDDREGTRDIAQFVAFNENKNNSTNLTSATLREIPGQLEGYFRMQDIRALPPVHTEEEEIIVEDEEDEIDLSLDIGEDEIVVSSGGHHHHDTFKD